MRNLLLLFAFGFIFFSFGCNNASQADSAEATDPTAEEETASEASPMDIINHHLAAFQENNIAELMVDYSETSTLMTPDTTLVGLQSLEAFFTEIVKSFPTEGTEINIDRLESKDNLVYLVWHGGSPTLDVPLGTDTFIIEDGKIEFQTFAGYILPKEEGQ